MNKFTKEMVIDYADKLLIGLSEEEVNTVLEEFEIIDKNINLINQIPGIEKVEAMTHCLDNFDYVLREDVKEDSVPIEELLQNCDSHNKQEVIIKKVVN